MPLALVNFNRVPSINCTSAKFQFWHTRGLTQLLHLLWGGKRNQGSKMSPLGPKLTETREITLACTRKEDKRQAELRKREAIKKYFQVSEHSMQQA